MKINETSIPEWVLEAISLSEIYEKLDSSSAFHEIEIEYQSVKYRLIFEINENNSAWILKKIFKRNPQGFWFNINF